MRLFWKSSLDFYLLKQDTPVPWILKSAPQKIRQCICMLVELATLLHWMPFKNAAPCLTRDYGASLWTPFVSTFWSQLWLVKKKSNQPNLNMYIIIYMYYYEINLSRGLNHNFNAINSKHKMRYSSRLVWGISKALRPASFTTNR